MNVAADDRRPDSHKPEVNLGVDRLKSISFYSLREFHQ